MESSRIKKGLLSRILIVCFLAIKRPIELHYCTTALRSNTNRTNKKRRQSRKDEVAGITDRERAKCRHASHTCLLLRSDALSFYSILFRHAEVYLPSCVRYLLVVIIVERVRFLPNYDVESNRGGVAVADPRSNSTQG